MAIITAKPVRKIGLALIVGALLLASPLAAQKNFNQEEKQTMEKYKRAKLHFLKGVEYLSKGKLEKVQKEVDASLEIFPGYSDAHFLLAQLQYQQGQYESALQEIENAKSGFSAIKEFYFDSYQNYIDTLREERDKKDVQIQDLTQALASAQTPALKQQLQDQINELKAIMATIDNRLREWIPKTIDIPADYHYIHGNILFKMKRYAEAIGFYEAAVQADPNHANAYNNLISILFSQGDMVHALKYVEQAEASGVTVNEKLKKAVLERK